LDLGWDLEKRKQSRGNKKKKNQRCEMMEDEDQYILIYDRKFTPDRFLWTYSFHNKMNSIG